MSATEERTEERSDDEQRNVGRIEEITGVVIEAVFPDELPEINHAIVVHRETNPAEDEEVSGPENAALVCEVQQHRGHDRVRAVAMDTQDGLSRGMQGVDTGRLLPVPVGQVTLGRLFNL